MLKPSCLFSPLKTCRASPRSPCWENPQRWWLKTKGLSSVIRSPLMALAVSASAVISVLPCFSTQVTHGSAVGHLETT